MRAETLVFVQSGLCSSTSDGFDQTSRVYCWRSAMEMNLLNKEMPIIGALAHNGLHTGRASRRLLFKQSSAPLASSRPGGGKTAVRGPKCGLSDFLIQPVDIEATCYVHVPCWLSLLQWGVRRLTKALRPPAAAPAPFPTQCGSTSHRSLPPPPAPPSRSQLSNIRKLA